MIKILIISSFLLSAFTLKRDTGCLNIDIILVGDFSSSVQHQEHFIAEAFDAFVDQFELSEATMKIGIVSFSNSASLTCPLTSNKILLKNNIEKIRGSTASGTTNMQDALNVANAELFGKNSREYYKKMIILISDGYPDSKEDVLTLSNEIKKQGVTICGILVKQNTVDPDYMKNVSSDFCFIESNYENLVYELKQIDICL